jgi:hypothetical protein
MLLSSWSRQHGGGLEGVGLDTTTVEAVQHRGGHGGGR